VIAREKRALQTPDKKPRSEAYCTTVQYHNERPKPAAGALKPAPTGAKLKIPESVALDAKCGYPNPALVVRTLRLSFKTARCSPHSFGTTRQGTAVGWRWRSPPTRPHESTGLAG
jgi:hypothetical protein